MSVEELFTSERELVAPWLPPPFSAPKEKHEYLPFVTLTYAQSMDGGIALAPGARTTLSGDKSKSLTHYLRRYHDAILVGAGTAAVDDPGLNCRYPGTLPKDHPRPIILDPNGRYQSTEENPKKAYRLAKTNNGKEPWIITRGDGPADPSPGKQSGIAWPPGPSLATLTDINLQAAVQRRPTDTTERPPYIPWRSILGNLKKKGINSVMIEGGATVINMLLGVPDLVDSVIVTIAPTYLGQGAVNVAPRKPPAAAASNAADLENVKWLPFGDDIVCCANLKVRPYKIPASDSEDAHQSRAAPMHQR